MKVYVSKRDENVTAKIIQEDEKFKTVIIEYLTGDKSGQNNSITTSTLKRWWKETEIEVENISQNDVTAKKPETIFDTESGLTDEDYANIGLEIAEQAKQKSKKLKDSIELDPVVTKLQKAGFTVNIVKGLPKTISIRTVGQLAISKNGYRLKANLNFEFTSETSYERTKNYNKVVCNTLDDVLKIIQ